MSIGQSHVLASPSPKNYQHPQAVSLRVCFSKYRKLIRTRSMFFPSSEILDTHRSMFPAPKLPRCPSMLVEMFKKAKYVLQKRLVRPEHVRCAFALGPTLLSRAYKSPLHLPLWTSLLRFTRSSVSKCMIVAYMSVPACLAKSSNYQNTGDDVARTCSFVSENMKVFDACFGPHKTPAWPIAMSFERDNR